MGVCFSPTHARCARSGSVLEGYRQLRIRHLRKPVRKTPYQAELNLSSARSDLTVLKKYTYTRTVAALKNGLLKAQRALKPVERKAAADIRQAEALLAATASEYKRQLALQAKYAEQIKECKVYAPVRRARASCWPTG